MMYETMPRNRNSPRLENLKTTCDFLQNEISNDLSSPIKQKHRITKEIANQISRSNDAALETKSSNLVIDSKKTLKISKTKAPSAKFLAKKQLKQPLRTKRNAKGKPIRNKVAKTKSISKNKITVKTLEAVVNRKRSLRSNSNKLPTHGSNKVPENSENNHSIQNEVEIRPTIKEEEKVVATPKKRRRLTYDNEQPQYAKSSDSDLCIKENQNESPNKPKPKKRQRGKNIQNFKNDEANQANESNNDEEYDAQPFKKVCQNNRLKIVNYKIDKKKYRAKSKFDGEKSTCKTALLCDSPSNNETQRVNIKHKIQEKQEIAISPINKNKRPVCKKQVVNLSKPIKVGNNKTIIKNDVKRTKKKKTHGPHINDPKNENAAKRLNAHFENESNKLKMTMSKTIGIQVKLCHHFDPDKANCENQICIDKTFYLKENPENNLEESSKILNSPVENELLQANQSINNLQSDYVVSLKNESLSVNSSTNKILPGEVFENEGKKNMTDVSRAVSAKDLLNNEDNIDERKCPQPSFLQAENTDTGNLKDRAISEADPAPQSDKDRLPQMSKSLQEEVDSEVAGECLSKMVEKVEGCILGNRNEVTGNMEENLLSTELTCETMLARKDTTNDVYREGNVDSQVRPILEEAHFSNGVVFISEKNEDGDSDITGTSHEPPGIESPCESDIESDCCVIVEEKLEKKIIIPPLDTNNQIYDISSDESESKESLSKNIYEEDSDVEFIPDPKRSSI